jgi:hypothetical protein
MVQTAHVIDKDRAELSADPDVNCSGDHPPLGFGRFLFRMSSIEDRLYTALPYLDALAMHLLFGTSKSVPTRRCTLMAARVDPPDQASVPGDLEREILIDLSPEIFRVNAPHQAAAVIMPVGRLQLAVELAHSVPLPSLIKKLAFGTYRLWLRNGGAR